MSWEPPEEPTQHEDEVDGGVPSQRMPTQQESATPGAADSDSDEKDDEPDWYPPPDAACM